MPSASGLARRCLRPCARLKREWQQVQPLTEQMGSLEAERRVVLRTRAERGRGQVRPCVTLRGIGVNRAWHCVMACFAGRDVQTPQEVGA
jgi:hypothetical protein